MKKMRWSKLLDGAAAKRDTKNRPPYERDLDRIIFSASFRRLANKTQVHPLYENDHLHTRMIHSVETGSVGRSLGLTVGNYLLKKEKINNSKQRDAIEGITQAACLAHDIGNPPFGHSGEEAIGSWFKQKFDENKGIFAAINLKKHQLEFENFEGNAQGLRIITRLEIYRNEGGMQLSNALIGAFTKYPVTAKVRDSWKESHFKGADRDYCGLKKFGIFESEKHYFSKIAKHLELIKGDKEFGKYWRRHPLVFLVEAADDICYNIIDLEDAFHSGDLSFKKVRKALSPLAKNPATDTSQTDREKVQHLRGQAIGNAVEACSKAFIKNYDDIMNGNFSSSLIEKSKFSQEFSNIKNTAKREIYESPRKMALEVLGRNSIHKVLDGFYPVIENLRANGWDETKLSGYEQQLIKATDFDLRDAKDDYSALLALTDHVSGMTDRFLIKTSQHF